MTKFQCWTCQQSGEQEMMISSVPGVPALGWAEDVEILGVVDAKNVVDVLSFSC